jgi:hypothetical protein
MVLLLRQPHFFPESELRTAAEKAKFSSSEGRYRGSGLYLKSTADLEENRRNSGKKYSQITGAVGEFSVAGWHFVCRPHEWSLSV